MAFTPSTWRAAWWAFHSYRSAGRQLRSGIVHPVVGLKKARNSQCRHRRGSDYPPPPGNLPGVCTGASAVVGGPWATCGTSLLESPANGMRDQPAHAWIEGTDLWAASSYLELHRLKDRSPMELGAE